jgi:hypothetical protein
MENKTEFSYEELIDLYRDNLARLVYEVKRKSHLEGYQEGFQLGKIAGIASGMEILIK